MAGINRVPRFEDFSGVLSQALDSEFVLDNCCGFSTIGFNLVVPTSGAIAFEGSFDGVNFEGITLRQVGNDGYISTTTEDGNYIGSISSFRKFRARVSTSGSADGSIGGRATLDASVLEGIEHGPLPHNVGGVGSTHKDGSFTTAQTDTILWNPGAGKKYAITSGIISASGATDATVQIFDETNSSGNYFFNQFLNLSAGSSVVIPLVLPPPGFTSSAAGNSLRLTTDAGIDISIVLNGYEFFA